MLILKMEVVYLLFFKVEAIFYLNVSDGIPMWSLKVFSAIVKPWKLTDLKILTLLPT